jgi:hypothetical protein
MGMKWNEIEDISKRIDEADLTGVREYRVSNYAGWKARIDKVDKLYRGEWDTIMPGESQERLEPMVANLIQIGLDDLSDLVSETLPSIRVYPRDDGEDAQKEAYLYESVGETYWEFNNGEDMVPELAYDVAGTGGVFVYADSSGDSMYPKYCRIDPRFCYPSIVNGKLEDLFVVHTSKLRDAAAKFPALGKQIQQHYAGSKGEPDVEIWEYYSEKVCCQAFALYKGNKMVKDSVHIFKTWEPDIGRIPVAFARSKSFDGELRGIFDQVDTSIKTKNRIIQLIIDYSDELTYAPLVSKGLLNLESEKVGPDSHLRLDPNVPDAHAQRMAPAGSSPQLYALIDFLEREQRSGIAYPAARQGEVSQSIASASFVNSTMGQLTSTVRAIQRCIGTLREDLFDLSLRLDKHYMCENDEGMKKPLFRAVGKVKTYKPYSLKTPVNAKIVYGAGAGLDRMNADTRILQHLGANLISRQTARENIDYIAQDGEEEDRIQAEQAENIATQKFLQEAPWQEVGKVVGLMKEQGIGLIDAIAQAAQEAPPPEAAPAPPPTPGAMEPPGPAPGEAAPGSEQMALQHGGVPGGDAEMMGGVGGVPGGGPPAPPPDLGGIRPPAGA